MIKIFSFILFVIISHKAIATVKGKTLICDKDRRGYNFISKDKVEVLSINFDELNIISINHSYELAENAIFIQQPLVKFHKEKITDVIFCCGFSQRFDPQEIEKIDELETNIK